MTSALLQAAIAAHQAGNLGAAASLYRQFLQREPTNPDANHNLAGILLGEGNVATALAHARIAVEADPRHPQYRLTLIECLIRLGELPEAQRNLLALPPGADPVLAALAWSQLGDAFTEVGVHEQAIDCYRHAVAMALDNALFHNNLGSALFSSGDPAGALRALRAAVRLKPAFAVAHFNLGNAQQATGDRAAAIASYARALELNASLHGARLNLGNALLEQGDAAAALAAYREILASEPRNVDALINLGKVLLEQGDVAGAIDSLTRAAQEQPDNAVALNSLGVAQLAQGDLSAALATLGAAFQLKPDPMTASNMLFAESYSDASSPEKVKAAHVAYAEHFEAPLVPGWPHHDNLREPDRTLHVGFVSGDLCAHPVGIFLEDVLSQLDASQIRATLYPTRAFTDATAQRLRAASFAWNSLAHLSDDAAAQRIRKDNIDILVDLSGHTARNRLMVFARKPAPIQVAWLGYFATTGLRAMDYILCDRHVLPDGDERYFTERPWRLPNSFLCFSIPREDVAVAELPALAGGHVTFGCFNNLTKLTERVVAVWSDILRRAPKSRLFLKALQLNDPAIRAATRERFAACGILAERLILEGSSPRVEYFATYCQVDLALDPFPYPGGTTTVEALWMGVPVLHRCGERFLSRMGDSILNTVGLPDWIARSDADYIAHALRRAEDLSALAELRAGLRQRLLASPLCDAPRFARDLETAFRTMWRAYCSAR